MDRFERTATLARLLRILAAGVLLGAAAASGYGASGGGEVKSCAAPAGEALSEKFVVAAGGHDVPVYTARVAAEDHQAFIRAMDAKVDPAQHCDETAFASFDLRGSTSVVVTCSSAVASAKVLPASAGITPVIKGNTVSLDVTGPGKLVLEVNGDVTRSLNIFANPWENHPPKAGDPNVLYFGPGIHEVDCIKVTSGQTVYIADGAILRERPAGSGPAAFLLTGSNIRLCGRGIIDGSLCPAHSRHLVLGTGCSDLHIEGVILRDSSSWTLPIRKSDRVTVRNVKIFGYRGNSDGIDLCNCRDVFVTDCFVRTWDDLIVVKSDKGEGKVEHVLVTKCVLWNELAHALSIGAELRDDIDDVRFADCDVIHDKGREWTLRIFHCDSAHVWNIRFENIRVAESRRLISLWIGATVWSREPERGHIHDVTFRNIRVESGTAQVESKGYDATHLVDGVTFDHVMLPGRPLGLEDIQQNAFSQNITVTP